MTHEHSMPLHRVLPLFQRDSKDCTQCMLSERRAASPPRAVRNQIYGKWGGAQHFESHERGRGGVACVSVVAGHNYFPSDHYSVFRGRVACLPSRNVSK